MIDIICKQESFKNIKTKCKVIFHQRKKFETIMKYDGITSEDIMNSMNIEKNIDRIFSAGEGAGQSGSFFFFSYDNRFIIKTMRGSERQNLLNMLDDLLKHIVNTSNTTLISKIYGVFTIKSSMFSPIDIIVMQNSVLRDNK